MPKKNKNSRIVIERISTKLIKTTECWYPNFENDFVRVSFSYHNDIKKYHISVWGADDFGLERWEFADLVEAEEVYHSIVDCTTQEELVVLFGFIRC